MDECFFKGGWETGDEGALWMGWLVNGSLVAHTINIFNHSQYQVKTYISIFGNFELSISDYRATILSSSTTCT